MTPSFVKYGEIVGVAKRDLKVQFDGESRPTAIPNAKWYYVQHKLGDKENGLSVWDGPGGHSIDLRPDTDGEHWLPAAEAAHAFGVKVKDLRRWLRAGKVKGHQRQGLWVVDAQSLGQWMADR